MDSRRFQQYLAGVLALAVSLAAGCDSSSVQGVLGLGAARVICDEPDDSSAPAAEVIALVNQERVLRGMNPLTLNERLSAEAADYACTMIEDDFFGHDHPETGDSFVDRHGASEFRCFPAGENLATGHTSAEMVVEDWMNSDDHRKIILNDVYQEMGLGLRRDSADGRLFWVQFFIGERVEGCISDYDLEEDAAPPSTPSHMLTGGLNSTPALPEDHNHEHLTDSPRVKPESVDPTAGE
ncbi:MAG: CAP domain-containing protein [Planctomycetes bacterium]|nr:CAP domain-containing protein [Planctomycetota bacterium]